MNATSTKIPQDFKSTLTAKDRSGAEAYDVVVVGSGSAGMMAALRAADLGLSTLVIEKASKFGGTSATSGGGIWIPNHGLGGIRDSREMVIHYLNQVLEPTVRRDRLESFIDSAPEVLRYLKGFGVEFYAVPSYPDYFPSTDGALSGRILLTKEIDGGELGDGVHTMREQFPRFKLFNRYAFDIDQGFALSTRSRGWQWVLIKMIARYWSDFAWRRKTPRDRRLTMGGALIGSLYRALMKLKVEVRLDTGLVTLIRDGKRLTGVEVSRFGKKSIIQARHGVVIAAGGFEWNQTLRDQYFEFGGTTRWSSTPEEGNKGDALIAAQAIGATTEHMAHAWWAPTMTMPIPGVSNMASTHQTIFDVGRPHSVCINRKGVRFVNEACSYDQFGLAMIADHRKGSTNLPCWLVFDKSHRSKYTCGGFLPTAIMPDGKIPRDWWNHYIFKGDSINELAAKIGIDPATLSNTVEKMNGYARTGVDLEFGRGSDDYDKYFGDPAVKPNASLGSIVTAPFYAVPINLGDLGTKGGLKADANACVLDEQGQRIEGLYAAGNAAGSPFGNCYPGSGATIGPALVFGYLAASDIASRAAKSSTAQVAWMTSK
jgi:3-oxosteroid 1-dehydrogenase